MFSRIVLPGENKSWNLPPLPRHLIADLFYFWILSLQTPSDKARKARKQNEDMITKIRRSTKKSNHGCGIVCLY
jgi:hypothetical protein